MVWKRRDDARSDVNAWNAQFAGRVAGRLGIEGYRKISMRNFDYSGELYEHRIIWALVHGEWPPSFIDHANGDKADNRIENLRPATHAQNQQNKRALSKRGFKGASYCKAAKRWRAKIDGGGLGYKFLGYFDTPEEAHDAYKRAAIERYGEFARV